MASAIASEGRSRLSPGCRGLSRRLRPFRAVAVLSLALVAGCASDGPAALRPRSMLALRFEATTPQAFDYTCGAASVSTMLTYHLGRPVTEGEVIDVLRGRYSLQEIARRRETGLSFDDLIYATERLGFRAQGAKVGLDQLSLLKAPVIIQLLHERFQHFAVLRRVGDGVYYVSDPIVGGVTMSGADFARFYSGYALAVWREGAPLPAGTALMQPHDGLSVRNTLEKAIDVGSFSAHPVI